MKLKMHMTMQLKTVIILSSFSSHIYIDNMHSLSCIAALNTYA
jgi:hypothetical protein